MRVTRRLVNPPATSSDNKQILYPVFRHALARRSGHYNELMQNNYSKHDINHDTVVVNKELTLSDLKVKIKQF